MVGGGWRREMNESYGVSSYFIDVSQFFCVVMCGVKQEFKTSNAKGVVCFENPRVAEASKSQRSAMIRSKSSLA